MCDINENIVFNVRNCLKLYGRIATLSTTIGNFFTILELHLKSNYCLLKEAAPSLRHIYLIINKMCDEEESVCKMHFITALELFIAINVCSIPLNTCNSMTKAYSY